MAVADTGHGSVRLDLGCGTAKCPGFVGADRFPLAGVDVIVELDSSLPFRSDSVDLLVMSHSLEHVRDLLATLKEVYRICRHGAAVCVVAPYAQQGLNLVNPFHLHAFNEHAPRFWTDSPHTLVDPAEFAHPHAPGWGLSRSDHGDLGIDLRCVSMEFFYFPEYRALPAEEQRAARKRYIDVCDQIMYQLIVVKGNLDEAGMRDLARRTERFEPPAVTARRIQERHTALHARPLARVGAADGARTTAPSRERAGEELAGLKRRLELWQHHARAISSELAAVRRGRLWRIIRRFWPDPPLQLDPAFRDLLDDSDLFLGGLPGYRLQASDDLRMSPVATYSLRLDRPNLCGLLLAPILDLPDETGSLGVELRAADGVTVARARVSLAEIVQGQPMRFEFPSVPTSPGLVELRVGVLDAAAPVRLLEWRRWRFFGFGPLATRPFCAYRFAQRS